MSCTIVSVRDLSFILLRQALGSNRTSVGTVTFKVFETARTANKLELPLVDFPGSPLLGANLMCAFVFVNCCVTIVENVDLNATMPPSPLTV